MTALGVKAAGLCTIQICMSIVQIWQLVNSCELLRLWDWLTESTRPVWCFQLKKEKRKYQYVYIGLFKRKNNLEKKITSWDHSGTLGERSVHFFFTFEGQKPFLFFVCPYTVSHISDIRVVNSVSGVSVSAWMFKCCIFTISCVSNSLSTDSHIIILFSQRFITHYRN